MTMNIVIPFKPYPQGKTRLANNGMNSTEIVLLQKRLLRKNLELVAKVFPSSKIFVLVTDHSLAKDFMPSQIDYSLIPTALYPSESLGKQLEAFLRDKEWENTLILVSDLANLLPTTLKAVYSLLNIYDGVIVPTSDSGTGIIGAQRKIFSQLDYFGGESARRFISKWEERGFLVVEFQQIPDLHDIDDLKDFKRAKENGYL